MSQINGNASLYSGSIRDIFLELNKQLENISDKIKKDFPDAPAMQSGTNGEVPVLPLPTKTLSLESLVNAIGFEQRRTNCQAGLESIEAKAQQQEQVNEQQLKELGEQLEKMAQQKVANVFKKIFGILGAIVGVIAGVASTAIGVMTGNPLLAAGGILGTIMAIDSVLSTATDGKISLNAGFVELGKACGMSDEAAGWFAMGMQLLLAAATIACSLGGSALSKTSQYAAKAAEKLAKLADSGQKLFNIANKTQFAGNIINGVVSTGQGATTIATTSIQYQISQSKVTQKELDAILERIRQSIEMEKDMIEAEMQRSNDLLNKVNEIAQESNAATSAILTGNPSFA